MNWYAIIFSSEQLSRLEYVKLEDAFELQYQSSGGPKGMTLFELQSFPSHPIYYVSPGSLPYAAHLLIRAGATQCEQPPLHELNAIAGDLTVLSHREIPSRKSEPIPTHLVGSMASEFRRPHI